MNYAYRVRDSRGGIIQGTMEAESRNSVIEALLRQQYTILDIREDLNREAAQKRAVNLSLFETIKINDLSLFTRQLSTWWLVCPSSAVFRY